VFLRSWAGNRSRPNPRISTLGSRKRGDSLANDALVYVQNWEAVGQPPELKQMTNPRRFERVCTVLSDDPDVAWARFTQAPQQAVTEARAQKVRT
jgi:hypothetical protein